MNENLSEYILDDEIIQALGMCDSKRFNSEYVTLVNLGQNSDCNKFNYVTTINVKQNTWLQLI